MGGDGDPAVAEESPLEFVGEQQVGELGLALAPVMTAVRPVWSGMSFVVHWVIESPRMG
jgi:hypothetical protein